MDRFTTRISDLKCSVGKKKCDFIKILTLRQIFKYKYQTTLWILKQTLLWNNSKLSLQFYCNSFTLEWFGFLLLDQHKWILITQSLKRRFSFQSLIYSIALSVSPIRADLNFFSVWKVPEDPVAYTGEKVCWEIYLHVTHSNSVEKMPFQHERPQQCHIMKRVFWKRMYLRIIYVCVCISFFRFDHLNFVFIWYLTGIHILLFPMITSSRSQ